MFLEFMSTLIYFGGISFMYGTPDGKGGHRGVWDSLMWPWDFGRYLCARIMVG